MNLSKLFTFHFLLFTLTSCTLLYIPPVLETQEMPETLNIDGSRGLFLANDELILAVQLNQVPQEGWLMVQWFSDTNSEVGSDAQWIDSRQVGQVLNYVLPGKIDLSEGTWRAVVSFQNQLIRQFSIDVARTK